MADQRVGVLDRAGGADEQPRVDDRQQFWSWLGEPLVSPASSGSFAPVPVSAAANVPAALRYQHATERDAVIAEGIDRPFMASRAEPGPTVANLIRASAEAGE